MKRSYLNIIIPIILLVNIGFNMKSNLKLKTMDQPFQITVSVKDTIFLGEKIIFWFSVKNLSNEVQYIRSSFCQDIDGIPKLINPNNKLLSMVLRIKPKCADDFIAIEPSASVKMIYPYTLDKLYNLHIEGMYKLSLEYWGHIDPIKLGEDASVDSIISSNKVSFLLLKRN